MRCLRPVHRIWGKWPLSHLTPRERAAHLFYVSPRLKPACPVARASTIARALGLVPISRSVLTKMIAIACAIIGDKWDVLGTLARSETFCKRCDAFWNVLKRSTRLLERELGHSLSGAVSCRAMCVMGRAVARCMSGIGSGWLRVSACGRCLCCLFADGIA
jgi:hypothetical protein